MTMLSTISLSPTTPFARKWVSFVAAKLRHLVDDRAATVIADQERWAALAAPRQLDDRELKDIGLYRDEIAEAIERVASRRS